MSQMSQSRTTNVSADALPNVVFDHLVSSIAKSERDPMKSLIGFALS
jgi:hypothetical protein